MSKLVGNAVFGQSGGPTAVINASAAGVFTEALKQDCIPKIYGAAHGIKGILEENLYDISCEDEKELELLKTTPSSALGSVRYKLADPNVDETDYKRLLEVFKKYNIRYFFYNGGNDSMDTCNKVSKFMQRAGYECRVIGVPKTIDNDLAATDHCPGYGSAARYIAVSTMEVYLDARVYDTPMVCVLEIMGRNAGWLTAASALASYKGAGPDLIYLPENVFDMDKFISDVKTVYEKNNGKVIIAVSEGIKDKTGRYISEYGSDLAKEKDPSAMHSLAERHRFLQANSSKSWAVKHGRLNLACCSAAHPTARLKLTWKKHLMQAEWLLNTLFPELPIIWLLMNEITHLNINAFLKLLTCLKLQMLKRKCRENGLTRKEPA